MSHFDESNPPSKVRPRSNTNSFLSWRKPRSNDTSSPSQPPGRSTSSPLPVDALIQALTPPAVPSLSHARSLASSLSTVSPLPKFPLLHPILASLCETNAPVSFQAAGYDILSSYWEHQEAPLMSSADRLTCFSLFLGNRSVWALDLWEPRFKALRSLTKFGSEIVGVEMRLTTIFQSWIVAAFDGLHNDEERSERERSIELMHDFLQALIQNDMFLSRITDGDVLSVLSFYAALVEKAMKVPFPESDLSSSSSTRPVHAHRRQTSSLSLSSLTSIPSPTLSLSSPLSSPSTSSPGQQSQKKHPFTIAIRLYLSHLDAQLKSLCASSLDSILPLLFRALSFCASPLPRLTLVPPRKRKSMKGGDEDDAEFRVGECLERLLSGPYTATCMAILQKCLSPHGHDAVEKKASSQISYGAHRTLRLHVRRGLHTRLARAYINREANFGYSHSGAPAHVDVERDILENAWGPRENENGVAGRGWDAGRLGKSMSNSVKAWIELGQTEDFADVFPPEKILEEVSGTLKDIFQELSAREESLIDENPVLDDDEARATGETLLSLAGYVKGLRTVDNSPFILPLAQPSSAPNQLLHILASLLSISYDRKLEPSLSAILLSVAEHLSDEDTARIPQVMLAQNELSPMDLDWLDHWEGLIGDDSLMARKPLTRRAIMSALETVFEETRDMKLYRRPLADMAFELCRKCFNLEGNNEEWGKECTGELWRVLGEEIVLRIAETDERSADDDISKHLDLLVAVSSVLDGNNDDSPETTSLTDKIEDVSTIASPITSRIHSEMQSPERESPKENKDKEPALPSLTSILSSFTSSGNNTPARGGSHLQHETTSPSPSMMEGTMYPTETVFPSHPPSVHAVCALINVFCQIAFTPLVSQEKNLELAFRLWDILIDILRQGQGKGKGMVRITVLGFLMRLRADRDHRVYWEEKGYDAGGQVVMLANLIGKSRDEVSANADLMDSAAELRKARAKLPYERDEGRKTSRGRGGMPSRSRSRAPFSQQQSYPLRKPREPLWQLPEQFPFSVVEVDTPSEALATYDPDGPDQKRVIPISKYLTAILEILDMETNWEILSYVLCHLPVQLANKHLFCGPKSRTCISLMHKMLCAGILDGYFATKIDRLPVGLKLRDAHGLAYHVLSVLVSYRRCFDGPQRHRLVEVFYAGLDGQAATIKCCLHALSTCTFELQSSITKFLSSILEKLSQIMSNPEMAVHILSLLSIIGSHPSLYANFTEGDFKMVFGVALQYLQHYNKNGTSPTMSWALSQHVRILSYYLVYVWFLAVKLPDRPKHVPYITRQLLLANEGNDQVDEYTEVCFDWLARYTYASADPRPANSTLSDIVMNPTSSPEPALTSLMVKDEKSWMLGNSVVTIRSLTRLGWFEVLSRRPSGYSRFLCRLENAPMVGPGDVDPDTISIPASLLMDRNAPSTKDYDVIACSIPEVPLVQVEGTSSKGDSPPNPDPITGYVWSGSAPSQRRKEVAMDPAFFALQLSAYPDRLGPSNSRMLVDPALLPKFNSAFDRIPVIDTHKVGILYVAPAQSSEIDILRNTHGSPAYTRFLEGVGRLINLRGQLDVYAGGLDPDEDGEYAYAWWDDIGQILYHAATMMPTPSLECDPACTGKKRHIGNDYVRIVWNDSGMPYRFDTLATDFQFVNIVIEPHSLGAIAAFSNNLHENEYFKVTVQRAEGMPEFAPVGEYKLISAENLPLLVRQLSLLADWFASVFSTTARDTSKVEIVTNWQRRLQSIRRLRAAVHKSNLTAKDANEIGEEVDGIMGQEAFRDFTSYF